MQPLQLALLLTWAIAFIPTYLFAQGSPTPSASSVVKSGQRGKTTPQKIEEIGGDQDSKKKRNSKVKVERTPKTTRVKPKAGAEIYQQQISQIEAQVNELKEEIFRARTRLAILKETVLANGLAGTELQIIHRNEMGANFKLERLLYILDGSPIQQAVDKDGRLDQQQEIEIINGPITPGNHTLQVELIYRGNGYGIFSYLQSYRFTLNDGYTFRTEEGKRIVIKAVGYERGGVTVDLQERPDIRFENTVIDLDKEDQVSPVKK